MYNNYYFDRINANSNDFQEYCANLNSNDSTPALNRTIKTKRIDVIWSNIIVKFKKNCSLGFAQKIVHYRIEFHMERSFNLKGH